jgi:hypothetical protein
MDSSREDEWRCGNPCLRSETWGTQFVATSDVGHPRVQFLMAQATIGQIDARLTEIDDVLFKVSTGQTIMSDAEIIAMQAEAGRIMTTLAAALGKAENVDPKFMYERRDKIRQLRFLSACLDRHVMLNSQPHDEVVDAFRSILDSTTPDEDSIEKLKASFAYLFVRKIPVAEPKPKSLWSRIFGQSMLRSMSRKDSAVRSS